MDNLGKTEWIGTNYHLLYKNCNSFSNKFCKLLCNNTIPSWINRVASVLSKFPYLVNMLPEEYFTPVALEEKLKNEQAQKYQLLKAHSKIENKNARPKSTLTKSFEIKTSKISQISEVEKSKSNMTIKSVQVMKSSTISEKSDKPSILEEPKHQSLLSSEDSEFKESLSRLSSEQPNISDEPKLSSPSSSIFFDITSEKTEEEKSNKD